MARRDETYVEGNQWVLALSLPEDPNGKGTETDDDRSNNICLCPSSFVTSGKGEGNEEECDRSNEENGTDDVELPE